MKANNLYDIVIDEISLMGFDISDICCLSGMTVNEVNEMLIRLKELDGNKNIFLKKDAKNLELIFGKKAKYWLNIDIQMGKGDDKHIKYKQKTKMGLRNRK